MAGNAGDVNEIAFLIGFVNPAYIDLSPTRKSGPRFSDSVGGPTRQPVAIPKPFHMPLQEITINGDLHVEIKRIRLSYVAHMHAFSGPTPYPSPPSTPLTPTENLIQGTQIVRVFYRTSTIYDQDLPNKPTELSNPINSRTTESLNFAMEDEKPKGFVLF
ncbi:hypothetical protein L1887_03837 [Cichorium endivia]|nr:hypothetical protein L1887_03837 [Cichorium endivia]